MSSDSEQKKETSAKRGTERQEIRKKFAATSARVLSRLPTPKECESFPSKTVGMFLEQLRELAVQGTQAPQMDDQQFGGLVGQVAWADLGLRTGIAYQQTSGGGSSEEISCTKKCRQEKNDCLATEEGCDEGWPCWCCADCRFAYLACLADCIVSRSPWGGADALVDETGAYSRS